MVRVDRAIGVGVKCSSLLPSNSSRSPEVDVVPATLLPAAIAVRLLGFKPRISAILIKCHCFGDPHRIYEMPTASDTSIIASTTDHPIADVSASADTGFASRERAVAIKGVGCKTTVVPHYIGVNTCHQQGCRLSGTGSQAPPSGFSHESFPLIASMIESPFHPTKASACSFSASGRSHSFSPCSQTPTMRLPCLAAYSISQFTQSLFLVWGET